MFGIRTDRMGRPIPLLVDVGFYSVVVFPARSHRTHRAQVRASKVWAYTRTQMRMTELLVP